jgi:hypothetical protein
MLLGMLREEFRNTNNPETRRAAKLGYRSAVRQLSWEYSRHGQKLQASRALAQGFLATGQGGLLARRYTY